MFTVSLIGPDGVGKTTVAKRLESSLPMPVKYIYMGLNDSAANFSLPTTRIKHAIFKGKMTSSQSAQASPEKNALNHSSPIIIVLSSKVIKIARKTLGLVNLILEEWYRQFVAILYEKSGYIVIFDRHFIYDFYDFNGRNDYETVKRRIHDRILKKTMLEPDLVICLDAPGEVAFKRKGEFNIEDLEIKRSQYINLQKVVKNFVIIDASRGLDDVIKDVGDRIIQFYQSII